MKRSETPDKDFWEEYMAGGGRALPGKTAFDKLDAARSRLSERGFKETDWAAADCREACGAGAIMNAAKRYWNTPRVIFNNCGGVLCRDDVLKVFAHLLDADEYGTRFPAKSFYVFLGDKNTIPQAADCPAGSYEEDHIMSFCSFVNCYDFDKEARYMGHSRQLRYSGRRLWHFIRIR